MRIESADLRHSAPRPLPSFTDAALGAARAAPAAAATAPVSVELAQQQSALVRNLLALLVVCGDLTALRVQALGAEQPPQLPTPLGETLEHEIAGLLHDRSGNRIACRVLLRYDALLPLPGLEPGARSFLLETTLPMAQLHGQALRFDCLVDARAAWPLQMLLLSGLARFGARARGAPPPAARFAAAQPDAAPEDFTSPRAPAAQADDGGAPRIGVAQWFETRVLRAVTQFFWNRGWFV